MYEYLRGTTLQTISSDAPSKITRNGAFRELRSSKTVLSLYIFGRTGKYVTLSKPLKMIQGATIDKTYSVALNFRSFTSYSISWQCFSATDS